MGAISEADLLGFHGSKLRARRRATPFPRMLSFACIRVWPSYRPGPHLHLGTMEALRPWLLNRLASHYAFSQDLFCSGLDLSPRPGGRIHPIVVVSGSSRRAPLVCSSSSVLYVGFLEEGCGFECLCGWWSITHVDLDLILDDMVGVVRGWGWGW